MSINISSLIDQFKQYEQQQRAQKNAKINGWFSAQAANTAENDRANYLAQMAQQNQSDPAEAFRKRLEEERAQRDSQNQAYRDSALKSQLGEDLTNADRTALGFAQKAPSTAAPLPNYLAGAEDQDSYQTAMLQYRAAGGKIPSWYTGDFNQDQGNIKAAINATMTPQQQLVRQEAEQRLQDLQEARKARIELQKQSLEERKQQHALARENITPPNIVPTKNEQQMASDSLESALTPEVFAQLPKDQAAAAIREASAKAKALMKSSEGKGQDYDALVQEQVQQMISSGRLKPGKEGSWFFGLGGENPSFQGRGATPQAQTGAPATPSTQPAKLTSKADYDALPSGALYIHPTTGKVYRKK